MYVSVLFSKSNHSDQVSKENNLLQKKYKPGKTSKFLCQVFDLIQTLELSFPFLIHLKISSSPLQVFWFVSGLNLSCWDLVTSGSCLDDVISSEGCFWTVLPCSLHSLSSCHPCHLYPSVNLPKMHSSLYYDILYHIKS